MDGGSHRSFMISLALTIYFTKYDEANELKSRLTVRYYHELYSRILVRSSGNLSTLSPISEVCHLNIIRLKYSEMKIT